MATYFQENTPFPHGSALTARRLCFFLVPNESYSRELPLSLQLALLSQQYQVRQGDQLPEPASLGSFPLAFGQRKGPLLCSALSERRLSLATLPQHGVAWHACSTAARAVTGRRRTEPSGTEPGRAGPAMGHRATTARNCRWPGPGLGSHVIPRPPARLCAGAGNGDMKHVCAASRSRAEFPTVIILLPSLPAGCQRGGPITAPLLFK